VIALVAATYPPLWPFLAYFGLVVIVVAGMLVGSFVLGERHTGRAINEPYESGMMPTGPARVRLSIKFYLVAMFFVVFDLESLYLIAWAVAIRETGWLGFVEAMIFMAILVVALIYLWSQGALDWGPRQPRTRAR
jgi:NADH-quinone oxidoreductase subunit A